MKGELRRDMRSRLEAMPADEAGQRSASAIELLRQQPEFEAARVVLVYLSFGRELATDDLLRICSAHQKRILAPRVSSSNQIEACPIRTLPADLVAGFRGIREPRPEIEAADLESIDLVLVPGLAFDTFGYRLGRGGGLYDRLLARPEMHALPCGLCFELQVCPELPIEPHDEPVRMLVTDQRVRRF